MDGVNVVHRQYTYALAADAIADHATSHSMTTFTLTMSVYLHLYLYLYLYLCEMLCHCLNEVNYVHVPDMQRKDQQWKSLDVCEDNYR